MSGDLYPKNDGYDDGDDDHHDDDDDDLVQHRGNFSSLFFSTKVACKVCHEVAIVQ